MERWTRLFSIRDCPPGHNRFVSVAGIELAIFHLAGTGEFFATRNSCPHAGGNLSAGEVKGDVVTCPWHHWEFDLRSGACVHNADVCVRRFAVRVRDECVEVDLS